MPLSTLFITAQDEVNPPTVNEDWVIAPPVDTGGNYTIPSNPYGSYYPANDFTWFAVVLLAICVFVALLWWWMDRRNKVQLKDIRPSVKDLNASDVSLNRAAFMQMIPYMPPLIGITPVLLIAPDNPALALSIFIGLISMPAMLYMYMKNKSLEQNKGKVNMTGYLRTRDGIRNQYFWRNVRFQTEKHLNTEELELIEKAKVLKVGSIPVPEVKSDDKTDKKKDKKEKTEKDEKAKEEELEAKKKLAEEGPKIEYDKAVWKAEEIENMHAIPANINNEFDVYLMSKNVPATWEYVEGEDFDDYGYHDVLLTGPELREIATMHRVIENEDGSYRDVYVPIFLVMWDDKMSADRLKGIPPIDVTRDDGIAGLVKAIGVEERTTAGELNSITEQVMVLENEDKDIDDLSATLARKKALDFINAEKRLTMFDIGMLGTVSTLTAIIFAVVMFLLGFSMGG